MASVGTHGTDAAPPRARVYRSFPRPVDTAPRLAHGRTDERHEVIRRPYGATPRTAKGWQ
jgi:hypothetical protein